MSVERPSRPVPAVLKALGRGSFPTLVRLPGGDYHLERVLKHDFFAATGLLRRADGHRVILKIGRTADLVGLPGRWIGRHLARREACLYQALSDAVLVPGFAGWWGDCGFAHDFVPGRPLQRDDIVADDFFDQLETLIADLHARGIAYVDLEKCENIIVGEDGKPYLIDFQISWFVPQWWGRLPPAIWMQRTLQSMDRYHLLKHRRRTRPDQLSDRQLDQAHRLPFFVRWHRALVTPLQTLRRRVLTRVDPQYARHRREKERRTQNRADLPEC